MNYYVHRCKCDKLTYSFFEKKMGEKQYVGEAVRENGLFA